MSLARPAVALCALALLTGLPSGAAHGAVEAGELEVLLLADEVSDHFYASGGYDIADVFLGEAHVPEVGAGEAGDGFYFRAKLSGTAGGAGPVPGDAAIVFRFETPGGPVERTVRTDGSTIAGDFEHLVAKHDGTDLDIERAFVPYAAVGVAPGDTLSGFRVESHASGSLRDAAPGGVFLPGGAEAPMGDSLVMAESVALAGPGRYASVAVTEEPDGVYALHVQSLLQEGGQHVDLATPAASSGWTFEPLGETSKSLKANGSHTFRVRLVAEEGAAPLRFDILTDVGGRVGLEARAEGTVVTIVQAGAAPVAGDVAGEVQKAIPSAGLAALAAGLVIATRLRRR